MANAKGQLVYMDLSINGEPAGRLVFELFGSLYPISCANFVKMCEARDENETRRYRGTRLHLFNPTIFLMGGLHVRRSYFGTSFPTERPNSPKVIALPRRGDLVLLNAMPEENMGAFGIALSQLVTYSRYQHFSVIGTLVQGHDILERLEWRVPGSCVVIADSGTIKSDS